MNQRKILFVATVEQHLLAFHLPVMKWFQDSGFEVHVATNLQGRHNEFRDNGIVAHKIDFTRSPYSPKLGYALKQLMRVMRLNIYSLVHVHTPVAAFLGRLAARLTSTAPVLYTAHGFHFYRGAPWYNWLIYYTAERIAARWTDGLITMNSEDYENAQRLGFIPNKNLFFVHGVGVDFDRYSLPASDGISIRSALGIGPNEVVFTCIAELNKNKNHDFLFDAWEQVAATHKNAHLLLVGSGKREALLRRRVVQEHLPNVHFLGYRQDIPQILAATDAVVLASKREGLPRCIMEAMAAGRPVVATNVRGNRDLVDDRVTGLLVAVDDVSVLVKALKRLAEDSGLREVMGKSGFGRAHLYSLESVKDKMHEVYSRHMLV